MDCKFEPGEIIITSGIYERALLNKEFNSFLGESLGRHLAGDWGDISDEDKASNDAAISPGQEERLLSSYSFQGEKIWIITECDRSVTTILFPEEY